MKILVAKPGLDGHDKGAKVITQALIDEGFNVRYSGLHCSIQEIIEMVEKEEITVLGLSILSGSHISICRKIMQILAENHMNIPVFVGGIIPPKDIEILKNMGIVSVFPAGSAIADTLNFMYSIKEKNDKEFL